ncbi:MAG: KEOPS complex subunit Cgi121 [Thermoplasmata archaeon]
MKIYYVNGKPNEIAIKKVKNGEIIIIKDEGIISKKILESAYLKAKRSFNNNTSIGRDIGTEMMLYLATNRQISEALEKYGVKGEGKYFIVSENELDLKNLGFEEIEFKELENEELLKELEKIAIFELKK